MQHSRIYRNAKLAESQFDLERISDLIVEPNTFFWVDLVAPTEADLAKVGQELGLNSFAVEDAFKGRQRPKLEHFDSHLFINAYGSKFDHDSLELQTQEIAIFVTENGLITVRDDDGFDIEGLMKRWDDSAELAENGVAFLLWALLDQIVDGYFEVIQELDQELEELEDLLFSEVRKDSVIQRKSYSLRKALVVLRRIAVPMREVLNPIIKRDTHLRPRNARSRLDRFTARFGYHFAGNQLDHSGQPNELGDEESNFVGCDYRGANRNHRFLRTKRTVSGLWKHRRVLGIDHHHLGWLRCFVFHFQEKRLALTFIFFQ
jgi:Mg2+ and Co2+ transporter CorA